MLSDNEVHQKKIDDDAKNKPQICLNVGGPIARMMKPRIKPKYHRMLMQPSKQEISTGSSFFQSFGLLPKYDSRLSLHLFCSNSKREGRGSYKDSDPLGQSYLPPRKLLSCFP